MAEDMGTDPTQVMVNDRPRLVTRALRAWRQSPDTRALKRELNQGNPYVRAMLARRGLEYADGAIRRKGA